QDHTPSLKQALRSQPPAVARDLVPDLAVLGIDPADRRVGHALAVGDREAAHRLQADVLHERAFLAYRLEVLALEAHALAGPLASRLLAGLAPPGPHRAPGEGLESG